MRLGATPLADAGQSFAAVRLRRAQGAPGVFHSLGQGNPLGETPAARPARGAPKPFLARIRHRLRGLGP
jgi:hypothetical protein